MTSATQNEVGAVNSTANSEQPSFNNLAPEPSAPAPSPAKVVAKRVARTTAKNVAASPKPTASPPVTAVAKAATPRAPVKLEVNATQKVAAKTLVKRSAVQPKTAIATTIKQGEVKLLKAKKPKLVRDSFTIPKLEYLKLEELKLRSVKLGNSIKKSELIRAGIFALTTMSDADFLKVTKTVPAIKTGRPAND